MVHFRFLRYCAGERQDCFLPIREIHYHYSRNKPYTHQMGYVCFMLPDSKRRFMLCFFSPLGFWQWVVRVPFTQHEYIRQFGFSWVRPDRATSSFHCGCRCQLPSTYDVIASMVDTTCRVCRISDEVDTLQPSLAYACAHGTCSRAAITSHLTCPHTLSS
jgi:hypothetical protein